MMISHHQFFLTSNIVEFYVERGHVNEPQNLVHRFDKELLKFTLIFYVRVIRLNFSP